MYSGGALLRLILTFGDTARLVEGEDTTIEGGKREGNDK